MLAARQRDDGLAASSKAPGGDRRELEEFERSLCLGATAANSTTCRGALGGAAAVGPKQLPPAATMMVVVVVVVCVCVCGRGGGGGGQTVRGQDTGGYCHDTNAVLALPPSSPHDARPKQQQKKTKGIEEEGRWR